MAGSGGAPELSEGDESFLDEQGEEEDDEARGDALRAGHHRLLVRQQRHGGAHAPDQEPAQVPVHSAAASCLLSVGSLASPLLGCCCVWRRDGEGFGSWGWGIKAEKSTATAPVRGHGVSLSRARKVGMVFSSLGSVGSG